MKLIYLMDADELFDLVSTVSEWQAKIAKGVAEEFRSQDDIIWHNSELTAHGYDAFSIAYDQYYSSDFRIANQVTKQKGIVLQLCKLYKYLALELPGQLAYTLHHMFNLLIDEYGMDLKPDYIQWHIVTKKNGVLRIREYVDKVRECINEYHIGNELYIAIESI